MKWGFYGRRAELQQLREILARRRWFFCKIAGRRRIGKTTLIQQALRTDTRVLYVQIPDSGPAGVLSATTDAMDTFEVPTDVPRPRSLAELAKTVGTLARSGYVVALDEFQYVSRERLKPFCSFLQAEVDTLSLKAAEVPGGLLVLGSIHTEMSALLEDSSAPLYNRTTDELNLGHLDIEAIVEILKRHDAFQPERVLFLWTLFEGIPKFYRDCYEQNVLGAERQQLLERIFFASSSPLRTEADNWFLKELHGRYDVILKFISRRPGCSHAELVEHVRQASAEGKEQVGGYLQVLVDKYRLIESRLPIFAKQKARGRRYYLTDNFLRAWLAALASPVSALAFRPLSDVVQQANERLFDVEGAAFEKLIASLYEERSRKSLGNFSLTRRVVGYWDRADVEIDLVALSEDQKRLRLGTCKRSAAKVVAHLRRFDEYVSNFLKAFPQFCNWSIEKMAFAPELDQTHRRAIEGLGYIPEDLQDLTRDF